ncbi:MAG TPA: hypothetical protein VF574_11990 [Allosphingosinicella sp.]
MKKIRIRIDAHSDIVFAATGWIFLLSSALMLAASVSGGLLPMPVRLLDVILVPLVLGSVLLLERATPLEAKRAAASEAYHWLSVLAALPLALFVLFLVAPSVVHWEILLPGLAWRSWLLAQGMPAVLAYCRSAGPGGVEESRGAAAR